MASNESVPYSLLQLDDGRTKALFTVPKELDETLAAHSILCRGSSFDLEIDSENGGGSSSSTFLSTIFYSPHPQEAAQEIAKRLAVRIDHVGSFQIGTADLLGL